MSASWSCGTAGMSETAATASGMATRPSASCVEKAGSRAGMTMNARTTMSFLMPRIGARTGPYNRRMPGSSRRELEIVGAVAEALNSSPSVQQALEHTLELVTGLLGLQTGWVWLVDPESGHMYNAAARNLPPYLQEPVRMSGDAWCLCIGEFREGAL